MKTALLTTLLLLLAAPAGADIIYVDIDATGAHKGSRWADAYTDLQDALGIAVAGDDIWVAEGVYKPTDGLDQTISFRLVNGVGLYGGFDGTEDTRDERVLELHRTTLSGDLGVQRTEGDQWPEYGSHAQDNSYHVVDGSRTDGTAIIDGFTVTACRSFMCNCTYPLGPAGMWTEDGSPTIANLVFTELGGNCAMRNIRSSPTITATRFVSNRGDTCAGMWNSYSNPSLMDVAFTDNNSDHDAGAMLNDNSNPVLERVSFVSNSAANAHGGAIANYDSSPSLTNVWFVDNYAAHGLGGRGGAVLNSGSSSPTLVNVLFVGNRARSGGAISHGSGSMTLVNVTFWGNSASQVDPEHPGKGGAIWNSGDCTISNVICFANIQSEGEIELHNEPGASAVVNASLIAGSGGSGVGWSPDFGSDLGGNIDADPLFMDAPDGDFRLTMASRAINAGDSSALPEGLLLDLDGNPRIYGPSVDMGAYEFQAPSSRDIFAARLTPRTLNLGANGNTVQVQLSSRWTIPVSDIEATSIVLNGSIAPLDGSAKTGPQMLRAKFARQELAVSLELGMQVPLLVSGVLLDGTPFSAADTIRVIDPGQARQASTAPVHAVGFTSAVHWPALGDEASALDGYLSLDGGSTWAQLFAGLEGTTSFTWVLEAGETARAQLLVEGRGAAGVVHAISELFSISNAGAVTAAPVVPSRAYLTAAPNPFNPSTTISYGLPHAGHVELTIYDLAGRKVRTLLSERVSAGEHEVQWHGRDEAGKQVASGVYLYQLRAGEFVETERMVMVK